MGAPVPVKNAIDTWVNSAAPARNYGEAVRLWLKSGAKSSLLYFNKPWTPGSTIISAKLRVYTTAAWAGSVTLTAQRASSKWSVNKVTWSNKPAGSGPTAAATVVGAAAGTMFEIDVTSIIQPIANGLAWYGLILTTNSASDTAIHSQQSSAGALRPVLVVQWNDPPEAPDNLRPAGGRFAGKAAPYIAYDFNDANGDTDLSTQQVQIGASTVLLDAGTTTWDTGEVPTSVPEIDLSAFLNGLQDAGFEAGTTIGPAWPAGWAVFNSTLAQSAAQAHSGTKSMSITGTGATTPTLVSPSYPISAGMTASASLWIRAATTVRTGRAWIRFLDAAGAITAELGATNVAESNAAWTKLSIPVQTAPANTVSYCIVYTFTAAVVAAEVHYIDDIDLSWGLGPSWTNIPNNGQVAWRVRTRDSAGSMSSWSASELMGYAVKGNLTITSPAAPPNNFIWEGSPVVTWTFTGQTQRAYQVIVADASDPNTWLWDSGKITSGEQQAAIPFRIIKDASKTYIFIVRVWDALSRESLPGDPAYVEASVSATVSYDNTVTAVTALASSSDAFLPVMHLTFSSAAAPDYFQLQRSADGGATWEYRRELLPGEASTGGTGYQIDDNGASPYAQYQWRVLRVVNGKQSGNNLTTSGSVRRLAPFLMRKDSTDAVCFLNPKRDKNKNDIQALYMTQDGPPVLVTQRLGGEMGHVEGRFTDNDAMNGVTADMQRDRFERLRLDSGVEMTLYIANQSFNVIAYNFQIDTLTDMAGVTYFASFDWFEVPA